MIHVFDFFAYKENVPPVLTYLDFFHILRLGGVVSKARDYDIEYEDDSLISKDQFDMLNDNCCFVPLKEGFLAMDLEGFAQSIVELSFMSFPEELIENSFKEIITEFLYPNLMFHFPDLAKHYKENIRTILRAEQHKNFDMNKILDEFKNNKSEYGKKIMEIEEKQQQKTENDVYFEIKNRNPGMLINPIRIPGFENIHSDDIPNTKKKSVFKISPDKP